MSFFNPFVSASGGSGSGGGAGKDGRGISSIVFSSSTLGSVAGIEGATDTYRINYTDGTSSIFKVKNGEKGSTGEQGPKGDTGVDGFSPIIVVEQTETGATITATDKNGTTSVEIKNGKDGTSGEEIDLSEYAKIEDLVGQKTTDGGEIFNDYENNIAANKAHAEGNGTTASAPQSHAEGGGTTALAPQSHAEGGGTTASGVSSHAEGNITEASGDYSHAEGTGTTASGDSSHAEGVGTTASGKYSHAEGGGTASSGNYSHAEGNITKASAYCSHAEGFGTKASSDYQHVQGKYNIEDGEGKFAFIIGNGSGTTRSNAIAIDWNGLIYLNNSNTGIDLTSLKGDTGEQGPQGEKGDTGKGIESITFKNSSSGAGAAQPGAIDTYTITYTDGSHTEFQIKNGENGTPAVIDTEMSDTSENTVQNKVIKSYIDSIVGDINSILATIVEVSE